MYVGNKCKAYSYSEDLYMLSSVYVVLFQYFRNLDTYQIFKNLRYPLRNSSCTFIVTPFISTEHSFPKLSLITFMIYVISTSYAARKVTLQLCSNGQCLYHKTTNGH